MCVETDEIKQAIDKAKYISFDIFDTLVVRPFFTPSDLFYLLDQEFEAQSNCNISFHEIRMNGEVGARKQAKEMWPEDEDITISDIYHFIGRQYALAEDICGRLLEKERELEIQYAAKRKYAYELYQYALERDKQIVICSDMYLDEETIKKILLRCSITKWNYLYISSSIKKLKRTGKLYDYVLSHLKCLPGEMLHIGDDEISDVEQALKKGINAICIPKTKAAFEAADIFNSNTIPFLTAGTLINFKEVQKSVGYGAMTAIVSNKFFDNPYFEQNKIKSIYGDAYYMGYHLLGMHVVGIVQWIVNNVKAYGYKAVHFLSRDGWLIKQAYDIYKDYDNQVPESTYLFASREALLPAQIRDKLDFYDLPIEYKKYTPAELLNLLSFCTVDLEQDEVKIILKENSVVLDKKLEHITEYQRFMKLYIECLYSEDKHKKVLGILHDYFDRIGENEVMFDIGYSGRIQCAINRLLNKQVDVFLIHSDSVKNAHSKRKGGFRQHCFYDYSPGITGMLREYFLSEKRPACIGYSREGNKVIPVFEEKNSTQEDDAVVSKLHKGALDFVKEFYALFGKRIEYLPFKSQEVSLPFEGFLREANPNDYEIFKNCFSDDKIYGRNDAINIARFWRNRQKELLGNFVLKK